MQLMWPLLTKDSDMKLHPCAVGMGRLTDSDTRGQHASASVKQLFLDAVLHDAWQLLNVCIGKI